jgi:hypothetical protein
MKVIGANQRNRTFLVEIDSLELDRITGCGCGWNFNDGYVSRQFKVAETWDTLKAINNGKDELPKIANKLRALADLLQPIQMEVPTTEGTDEL